MERSQTGGGHACCEADRTGPHACCETNDTGSHEWCEPGRGHAGSHACCEADHASSHDCCGVSDGHSHAHGDRHSRAHGHHHGHAHGHAIDNLAYQSKLRYVNAGVKFALATLTLVVLLVSRSISAALACVVAMALLTIRAGGISARRYRGLMMIPLFFLIAYVLVIGTAIRQTPLELFALRFGSWYLTASWSTVHYAVQLFCTALGCVSCLYFLSCNTPMTDILEVLRRLHLPPLFIELTMLIYRYIFVLLERAEAIRTAQNSRLGNVTYRRALQTFGDLCSRLFIQAIKRSERLFDAMEARGYDGTIRVLSEEHPARRREVAFVVVFEIALILISLIVRL